MDRIKTLFFVMFLFLLAPPIFSAESIPADLIGHYGFDWFQETKAQCAPISKELQAQFKACRYSAPGSTGSFTGKADFTSCKISKKSEYMIYKTKSRCSEELEAMKAMAP